MILTADGSPSLRLPAAGITYHSIHGAIRESMHVFIGAGLRHLLSKNKWEEIRILEMGLGTGLNALLTGLEAEENKQPVLYEALEAFPLSQEEALPLNYPTLLGRADWQERFMALHAGVFNQPFSWTPEITFTNWKTTLQEFTSSQRFHLVYYDAFAPAAQPELWTADIFQKLNACMEPGGLLVTYCSKGDVQRALKAAGFIIEKIPGPPGKREMLRATVADKHLGA